MYQTSFVIRYYNEEQHSGRLPGGIGIMQLTVQDVEIVVAESGSANTTLSIASGYLGRIASLSPRGISFGKPRNSECVAVSNRNLVISSADGYLYTESGSNISWPSLLTHKWHSRTASTG
jgi:hypothetical protein